MIPAIFSLVLALPVGTFAQAHESAMPTVNVEVMAETQEGLKVEVLPLDGETNAEALPEKREEDQIMRTRVMKEQRAGVEAQEARTQDVRVMNQERTEMMDSTGTSARGFQEQRESMMKEQQEKKAEVLLQAKERHQQVREEMEARMEHARQRTAEVLDARKAEMANRFTEQINRVNKNLSNRYFGHLHAMEIVLKKIEGRIEQIEEARGVELSGVSTAIQSARESIALAREMIADQQVKLYVVDIESMETAGRSFQNAFQELRADHTVLRDSILGSTRNIVREVMETLKRAVQEQGEQVEQVEQEEEL
ncbi:MAG: hypothetical protein Q8P70_00515 [bacterium]|nr:hypothetical protein [bacterium]